MDVLVKISLVKRSEFISVTLRRASEYSFPPPMSKTFLFISLGVVLKTVPFLERVLLFRQIAILHGYRIRRTP